MKKRRSKYKWNSTFKVAAQRVNECYRKWKRTGKDPYSTESATLKAAKKLLRKAQRQAEAKRKKDIQQSVMDSYRTTDPNDFFKSIKKHKQKRK